MVGPHLINERATLWERDEMVWIASGWRNNAIQIGWQESLFTGAANDPPGLRGGGSIAHQHLDPIKDKRLRPEEGCAQGVENVSSHVIAVRPDAQLGIIKEVAGQVEVVPVPGAGGVAGLGYGNTLVLGDRGAARDSKLADNPAVGELIIDHHRITAATLASAAKAGPN